MVSPPSSANDAPSQPMPPSGPRPRIRRPPVAAMPPPASATATSPAADATAATPLDAVIPDDTSAAAPQTLDDSARDVTPPPPALDEREPIAPALVPGGTLGDGGLHDVAQPLLSDADKARWPAASNSDSPARGVVKQGSIPLGKEITGGFSDGAELQYFALNGQELFALVETLMDELHARCQNDLRFNEALTYPQVRAKVQIVIEGFARDAGTDIVIERVSDPQGEAATRTPREVAATLADEVVFVLVQQHVETAPDGTPVTAPDEVREQLGMPVPRKHAVRMGGDRHFVDIA